MNLASLPECMDLDYSFYHWSDPPFPRVIGFNSPKKSEDTNDLKWVSIRIMIQARQYKKFWNVFWYKSGNFILRGVDLLWSHSSSMCSDPWWDSIALHNFLSFWAQNNIYPSVLPGSCSAINLQNSIRILILVPFYFSCPECPMSTRFSYYPLLITCPRNFKFSLIKITNRKSYSNKWRFSIVELIPSQGAYFEPGYYHHRRFNLYY